MCAANKLIPSKSVFCYFWRYQLIREHPDPIFPQGNSSYGICIQKVSMQNGRLTAQTYQIIHAVSSNRIKVRRLLALCNRYHLHPNHIYDVLEDLSAR